MDNLSLNRVSLFVNDYFCHLLSLDNQSENVTLLITLRGVYGNFLYYM